LRSEIEKLKAQSSSPDAGMKYIPFVLLFLFC
jgi:hypothetical protein